MHNQAKFIELRSKYPEFIYESYEIIDEDDAYKLIFTFNIPGLVTFKPTTTIPKKGLNNKNINKEYFNTLVFHLGLIELVSYFKCTCSPNVIIKCGYLDANQIKWFKKLYYNGLGEFLYVNGIDVSEDELMHITCLGEKIDLPDINYQGIGNLIPVGGGKDSVVTLELLKEEAHISNPFMINPKDVMVDCCKVAGYNEEKQIKVKRTIDKNLLELNKQGFLNGHTPFSSLVAFLTYLCAYISGKKYILLSNEASANEPTIPGTNINHQYSKTYEFEVDFNDYTKKYFNIDIQYLSFLRPLQEIQIAKLFAGFKKYHPVVRSCNVGSKEVPWKWCANCAKCLFVYIILSPFLKKDELINMFGEDLYEKESLLPIFLELLGKSDKKPFECIGTIKEVTLAVSLVIKDYKGELPYLLKYYEDNYQLDLDESMLSSFNEENNLNEHFKSLIKKAFKENKIINLLKDKNIAILGFGKEGKSTYNYIRKYLQAQKLTILDGNDRLLASNPELLKDKNLEFVLGNNYLYNLGRFDYIIKSPGISLKDLDISEFKNKITSQMNLVLENTNAFVIGVTGTKGKSTTASLIYEVLKDQGKNVLLAGNVGIPVLDLADELGENAILVAEFSSYQLEFIKKSPDIGIITNLYQDHLDFHGGVENYFESKLNMFKYQSGNNYAIYNADNKTLVDYINKNKYQAKFISVGFSKDNVIRSDENKVYLDNDIIYDLSNSRNLIGQHNISNIMLALGVVKILNLDFVAASDSINKFVPLKHRLECVGTYNDITFYDDAIATIPEATIGAISSIGNIDTLIFGGMDRGIDYSLFAKDLTESSVNNFICMPDTGYKIAKDIEKINNGHNIYLTDELDDAVKIAYEVTKKGCGVLLSPAAPSYNKYKNFVEKGEKYVEFIKKNK